jgi:hypothetical protein
VEIQGESKTGTVLYNDGTSSNLTPSGYSLGASGVPLSTISRYYKHIVFATNSVTIRNLTLEGNEIKYPLHLDYGYLDSELTFEDCIINAMTTVSHPVGIGAWSGQHITFNNCTFISASVTDGIFIHNWNNQANPIRLVVQNCFFQGCGFMSIDELGSGQNDNIYLYNCNCNIDGKVTWWVDVQGNGLTYWINPATGVAEPDPTKVPYCITLHVVNSNVGTVNTANFPYGSWGISRPLYATKMIYE